MNPASFNLKEIAISDTAIELLCFRIGLGVLILISSAPVCFSAPALMGPPVLFETDLANQPSDLLALTQAMRLPGMNLVGISIAPGNPPQASRLVHALAHLAGRDEILVGQSELTSGDHPWMNMGLLPDQPIHPATGSADLMISLSKKYPKELVVLATGPLTSLAKAIQSDSDFASRIKRVFISQAHLEGNEISSLSGDVQSASQVFSSTIPVTLLEERLATVPVLSSGCWMRLAAAHTSLTDYLLQHLAHAYPVVRPHIPIPACLAVAYLGQAATGTQISRPLSFQKGSFVETPQGQGRQYDLLTGVRSSMAMKTLEESIRDADQDFSTTFANLILSLKKLQRENLTKIQEALQEGAPVAEIPPGADPEKGFREQKLAYISWYIRLFNSIQDPVAEHFTVQLKETFLRMAGIGLVPPFEIYRDWSLGYDPGQPIHLPLGVSNQARMVLRDITLKADCGSQAASSRLAQTSEETTWIDLTLQPDGKANTLPNLVFSLEFSCGDVLFQKSLQVPLKTRDPMRIEAIRPFEDGLDVAIRVMEPVSLVATPADKPDAAMTSRIGSMLSWNRLNIPASDFGIRKGIQISFKGSSSRGSVYGLLEPATATFCPEPEGPSKSSCFADQRGDSWGWRTDGLSGASRIEYRVNTAGLPDMATGSCGITVDFYDEGDSLDTFRIEAASETAQFVPVTAWLIKGDATGWRRETFRLSPAAEELFRKRSVQWLRIDSHLDGDELIRSVAVHKM